MNDGLRRPPRLAEWLLAHALPAGDAEFLLGDLAEAYAGRVGWRARLWYWGQTFRAVYWASRRKATSGERGWQYAHRDLLSHDLRYALRGLRRSPTFGLGAVLVLALGVGTYTTAFSVVDAVLLRPLPFPEAERLVLMWETQPTQSRDEVGPSPGDMTDWRRSNRSFSGIAGWYAEQAVSLEGEPHAEKVLAAWVTTDFFAVLGREPILGRTFSPEEVERQEAAVVMSHALWRGRYGGDPGLVGTDVVIDGVPSRVLGVMPRDFTMPSKEVGLWTPWNFERGYAHRHKHSRRHIPTGTLRATHRCSARPTRRVT